MLPQTSPLATSRSCRPDLPEAVDDVRRLLGRQLLAEYLQRVAQAVPHSLHRDFAKCPDPVLRQGIDGSDSILVVGFVVVRDRLQNCDTILERPPESVAQR